MLTLNNPKISLLQRTNKSHAKLSTNTCRHPRITLTHGITPIEHLPRLSAQLNCNIYVKRDDCTGLGGGGNKARKLEYLFGEAKAQGADTVITLGGLQSNHARQTAAGAAKLGLSCELILKDIPGTPKKDYYHSGNLLLDKLFGATVHQFDQQTQANELNLNFDYIVQATGSAGTKLA